MKDKLLFESVERELNRQRSNIELIASENFVSEEVLELEFVKFMVLNMLMFNHIVERKPIQQFT